MVGLYWMKMFPVTGIFILFVMLTLWKVGMGVL